jgi:hypothetical protein
MSKITQPPAWSEAEIDLLKRIFPVSPDNVLAAAFQGRTIAAIKNQAAKRGLRRTDEYRAMRYQDRSAVMLSESSKARSDCAKAKGRRIERHTPAKGVTITRHYLGA